MVELWDGAELITAVKKGTFSMHYLPRSAFKAHKHWKSHDLLVPNLITYFLQEKPAIMFEGQPKVGGQLLLFC